MIKLPGKAFDNLDTKQNFRKYLKMQRNQLKLGHRQVIEKLISKMTKTEITRILGCHRSTVCREIKRNSVSRS